MTSAEDIKAWLKRVGKNREWLAEKTLVSKGTVNGWLSTGKPIPSAKLALIEKLMSGEEEIEFELPPDFEKQLRAMADEMHKNLEDMVSHILQVTARAHQKRKAEAPSQQFTPVEPLPAASFLDQPVPVIGNIAAGALTPGDNIPYQIKTDYQLGKGEYVLQVEGKSMEPVIPDGSLVVMRKHTIPPIPKVGTIVEYNDERGVTLKKLGRKKNPETGKWNTYYIHLIPTSETSNPWTAAKSPASMWKPWTGGRRLRNTPSSREAYVSFTPRNPNLIRNDILAMFEKW